MKPKVALIVAIVALAVGGGWMVFRYAPLARRADPAPAARPQAAPTTTTAVGAAPVQAAPQPSPAETGALFVAVPYDQSHVVFVFDQPRDLSPPVEKISPDLRAFGKPDEKLGDIGQLWEADPKLIARYPGFSTVAHVGEEFELQIKPGQNVRAVIKAPILADLGCLASLGFVAEVAAPGVEALSASANRYFLMRRAGGNSAGAAAQSSDAGEIAGWTATPAQQAQIEHLLQDAVKAGIAKVHADMQPDYDRAGADPAWVQSWRKHDEALARGEGKLNYEVQAFRLAPAGGPRLYVRAQWTIEGESVFLMTAWMRTEPEFVLEAVDPNHSRRLRWAEADELGNDLASLPKVMNVVDRTHDGWGDLLIYMPGLESYEVRLFHYSATGPVASEINISGGC